MESARPIQGGDLIEVVEKLAELVRRAPAGGVFHDAVVPASAGMETLRVGDAVGFEIRLPQQKRAYRVLVQPV